MKLNNEEILDILQLYGIDSFSDVNMIDSSHGDDDIRHNYILDKKYVLRVNNAKVMTETRIKELNTLIKRYNNFGIQAPYYLSYGNEQYVYEYKDCYCYVSEYLDCVIADDVKEVCREQLQKERVIMVAKFAQAYKNVDLIETLSMYSLFDLCPYDQLSGLGIDEKQDNINNLIKDVEEVQEYELVKELYAFNDSTRNELLSYYKELPRCVFQGDENYSNVCVDDNYHICGLFDFNMSGTEVIANYLANIALQGNYFYEDEIMQSKSAKEIFDMVISSFTKSTDLIKQYYAFEDREYEAYLLYAKIAMVCGYWNQYAFSEYIKRNEYKGKIVELLRMLINE